MLSRKENNKYRIQLERDQHTFFVSQKQTDSEIRKLEDAIGTIKTTMKSLYDKNWNLYHLLNEKVFRWVYFEFSNGDNCLLRMLQEKLNELQSALQTQQNQITEPEEIMTLRDFGFTNHTYKGVWKKVLEDTDEKEITEEIQLNGKTQLRRIRTVLWEKTDYGKQSTSITYRKLKIGKKLMQAIENTKKE